ncbi:MAG: hypothetical protein M1840_001087 [Geoglossum simile]|nr:MAG: hypothetical protein M1840_001087 [Geoglossum simile]
MARCPLSSPTRQYALNLTKATEHLSAQVVILRTANKQKEEILGTRKQRLSGKRKVLQGHFILTTSEIRDKVLKAEAETVQRKRKRRSPKPSTKQPTKRKRLRTPVEELEDTSETSSDDVSTISECIAVSWC